MSATAHAILECQGLSKTYTATDPPARVLDDVNLSVRPSEFLVVIGASGSGKSTLLYSLSGMDRPSAGEVRWRDRPLTSLDDAQLSRMRLTEMGFVFQQAYLLASLSLRDNVLLPALKAAPREKRAAIRRVDGLLERFGIAHVQTHGITQVSGGQLQRASICRALACDPAIVFADEPTGALNSSTTSEVMDALTDVHRDGTTVVMVTHDPACAARGDRVVYLRDGRLVDEREFGPWTAAASGAREDDLLGWLRGLGF